MKKLFLASAVSALFAAPATVLAQAKPAPAPTLDKVLEASGISVSGYIDAGYTHSDRNQAAFTTRVFDQQNNSFGLNQFGLTVAKQPKEGFGGLVNLTVGKDAQVITPSLKGRRRHRRRQPPLRCSTLPRPLRSTPGDP